MILDDSKLSEIRYSPVCARCANLTSGPDHECKAYKKIPDEIWDGKNNHKSPFSGDNGIQFVARSPVKKSGPVLTMTGTDPRPDTDYDPAELAMGIKTEMEHTEDPAIAKKIAKDQLDEDPKFYTHSKAAGLI